MSKYRWKSGIPPLPDNVLDNLADERPSVPCASLPAEIEKDLRRHIDQALHQHGIPRAKEIVDQLVEEVSYAYAGRQHVLRSNGAGRPPNGPAMLLSVNIVELLGKYEIQGNWQSWPGKVGPAADLEAIAQTFFRLACGEGVGILARPARTSEARKTLGAIHRNDPVPKLDPKN